jgi:hypothetical protein
VPYFPLPDMTGKARPKPAFMTSKDGAVIRARNGDVKAGFIGVSALFG